MITQDNFCLLELSLKSLNLGCKIEILEPVRKVFAASITKMRVNFCLKTPRTKVLSFSSNFQNNLLHKEKVTAIPELDVSTT